MKEILRKICIDYSDEHENFELNLESIHEKIMTNSIDFSAIKHKDIYQNNKKRHIVWFEKKCIEEITTKYLKKRIDKELDIKYPNRKTIMSRLFEVTEVLGKFSDFTIFKFDFKDFFNSLSSKTIFEKYIRNTKLYRYEIDLLYSLFESYDRCYAGIATSNALVEIISREFDKKIESEFYNDGLLFYSRFVDDGILIFNQNITEEIIREKIKKICLVIFDGHKTEFNDGKTKYISLSKESFEKFSYLGYSFTYNEQKKQFIYGISESKLDKYNKKFNRIVELYKEDNDIELLRERYLFLCSRVVFYNNFNSHSSDYSKWDVIGICDSYLELRPFLKLGNRIDIVTHSFLKAGFNKTCFTQLGKCPYFIGSIKKQHIEHNNNILLNRMYHNKSIVFHPHIGWTTEYLVRKIEKIAKQEIFYNISYRELVKKYCSLISD